MAISWSARRQIWYYGVAAVIGFVFVIAGWQLFFTHAPTCFDGIENGTELGVDCGGSCVLICQEQVRPVRVLWSRAFKTDTGIYTAAAYIDNTNVGVGARSVRYSFNLYDENNVLVIERDGVIDLPPMTRIPIVETSINVGSRTVARTLFSFADTPVWNKVTKPFPDVRLSDQSLEQGSARLSATITNNSVQDAGRTTVAAILFDSEGVARGASKTVLNKIPKKSSLPVVFTWPMGAPDVIRAEMTVIPSF